MILVMIEQDKSLFYVFVKKFKKSVKELFENFKET